MTDVASNSSTTAEVEDGVYHGQLDFEADIDWIAVELIAGIEYTIRTLGSNDQGGTLEIANIYGIYDANSNLLDYDDSTYDEVPFTPTTSGTYFIAVDSWGGGPGSYTLQVTRDQTGDETDDLLTGTDDADSLAGANGDDTLVGGASNDLLDGQLGDDILTGGDGADTFIFKSVDWDAIRDGEANLWGNDTITDFNPDEDLIHFAGRVVRGLEGYELTVTEVDGNTVIEAYWGDTVTIEGVTPDELSDDNFKFREGVRILGGNIEGSDANEALTGTDANDTIYGYGGNDTINGGAGDNYLRGFDGDDLITGGAGFDIIGGEAGNDTIIGAGGDDYILSNEGDDSVSGGSGHDMIETGIGNDTLISGSGNDTLRPGRGDDQISGGAGRDEFVIGRTWGNDTISDFDLGDDTLDFRGSGLEFDDLDISESDGNTIISDGVNTLTLEGVDSDDLVAAAEDVFLGAGSITSHYSEYSDVDAIGDSDEDILVETSVVNDGAARWTPDDDGVTRVSYSFLNYNSIAVSDDNSTWWYDAIEPVSPFSQYIVELEIARIESYTNLDLVWVEDFDDSAGNIRLGYHSFIVGGASTTPYEGPYAADVFIGTRVGEAYHEGYFIHELGHSLGFDDLPNWNEFTGQEYTIMSYVKSARYEDAEYGTDSTAYMYADIAGLQYLYGIDEVSTAGDETFTFDVSADDPVLQTIFDVGGTDTIEVTGVGDPVHINLTPGTWSNIGADARYEWWDAELEEVIRVTEPGTVFIMPNTIIEKAFGGDGDDTLTGNDADNVLRGGLGHDISFGGAGNDQLWAGSGDTGNDTLDGGEGDDTLGGGAGDDSLSGGAGEDLIWAGTGNDFLSGGADNDVLGARDGNDTLSGDGGNDALWAGVGADEVYGGNGADQVGAGPGDDTIYGGAGNDTISGGQDTDDTGLNDVIYAGGGNDVVYASVGNDSIFGDLGDDNLYAGAGNDTVHAGAGNDSLWGSPGDDIFTGGEGADIFSFGSATDTDVITDFDTDDDTLDLSGTTTDFTDTASVTAAASDTADGLLIDLGGGNSVLLQGLSTSDIEDMTLVL